MDLLCKKLIESMIKGRKNTRTVDTINENWMQRKFILQVTDLRHCPNAAHTQIYSSND